MGVETLLALAAQAASATGSAIGSTLGLGGAGAGAGAAGTAGTAGLSGLTAEGALVGLVPGATTTAALPAGGVLGTSAGTAAGTSGALTSASGVKLGSIGLKAGKITKAGAAGGAGFGIGNMTTAEKIAAGSGLVSAATPFVTGGNKPTPDPVKQDIESGITPPGRRRRRSVSSTVQGGKRNSLGG